VRAVLLARSMSRSLNDPPQLARLLVGDGPSSRAKCKVADRSFTIVADVGSEEPRLGFFAVDDTEASFRQGDNDCAVLNSDLHVQVIVVFLSPAAINNRRARYENGKDPDVRLRRGLQRGV
jgi:hypothetical protein